LKRKEKILRNLRGANTYSLGSHERCGFGFIADESHDPQEGAASEASRLTGRLRRGYKSRTLAEIPTLSARPNEARALGVYHELHLYTPTI